MEEPEAPQAVSEEDKASAEAAKLKGNDCLRAGDLEGALRQYSEAISIDSSNPVFFGNRAAVQTKLKKYNEAIEDCKKAIALDPAYVKAYSRLGLAYYHLGQYQQAIDEGYGKAVELDPTSANAKKDLENTKRQLQNSSDASRMPAGMPNMGDLGAMMQNPAVMQMAQQMMGGMGGGGSGTPDLASMMAAMGGGGAAAAPAPGSATEEPQEVEDISECVQNADEGTTAESECEPSTQGEAVTASQTDGNSTSGAASEGGSGAQNKMQEMEDMKQKKLADNPRLAGIMAEVQRNPMAIMQHMQDPEVMELVNGMMGGMFGGGGANPLAAMMAGMGGMGGGAGS